MFLFNFRKCLQDIRSLPICGLTKWAYSAEQCTCRTRIALFHLTIDGLYLLNQPYIQNADEASDRYEGTYVHLRVEMPFLFRNDEFYDFFIVDGVLV